MATATIITFAEQKYIAPGILQQVAAITVSGIVNHVGGMRPADIYVNLTFGTSGTSSMALEGAHAPTGPWNLVESVTGKSMTALVADGAWAIKEKPPFIRWKAGTVTTANTITARITANIIGM